MAFLGSCRSTYMLDKQRDQVQSIDQMTPQSTYKLKADDKISLSIWNHDDLSIGSIYGIYNSNEVYGKWEMINSEGTVSLPMIGNIKIEGLSISEAEQKLSEHYKKHIQNPIIDLKILNHSVSILGEVRDPGNYPIEKQENRLLEYIAKAGGTNFYANTKSVLLIRDNKTYQLNLNRADQIQKTNLLLKHGDVIHIPSSKGKKLDKKAPTLIPFASVLTTIALVFSLFKN